MKEMNKEELINVTGGGGVTAAFLAAVVKGASVMVDIGRSVGTAIRRIYTGKICGCNQ